MKSCLVSHLHILNTKIIQLTINKSNLQELLYDDTIAVCQSKSLNILSSEDIHHQDHNMPY